MRIGEAAMNHSGGRTSATCFSLCRRATSFKMGYLGRWVVELE